MGVNVLNGMPARYLATPPTLTDGQPSALMVDSTGKLLVAGSFSGTSAVNLTQIAGNAVSAGNGASGTGTLRVTLANDSTGTVIATGNVASGASDSGNPVKVGGRYNVTLPTLTDGQRSDLQVNVSGGLIMGGSTVASGATDSGNPIKTGGVYMSTQPTVTDGQRVNTQTDTRGNTKVTLMTMDSANQLTAAATNSDTVATSATASRLQVNALGLSFDGTNYNRDRTITNATNSTGTGIKAVGLVAQFDDTAPTAITENQFGNVRMTANRALMVEQAFSYGRATADTQIKASAGFVHTITIAPTGSVTAGVLTVYDNTAESGTVIFSVSLPVTTFTPFTVTLNVRADTGIYVGFDATLANVQATVSYR